MLKSAVPATNNSSHAVLVTRTGFAIFTFPFLFSFAASLLCHDNQPFAGLCWERAQVSFPAPCGTHIPMGPVTRRGLADLCALRWGGRGGFANKNVWPWAFRKVKYVWFRILTGAGLSGADIARTLAWSLFRSACITRFAVASLLFCSSLLCLQQTTHPMQCL